MQRITRKEQPPIISSKKLSDISSGIYLLEFYADSNFNILRKKFLKHSFKGGYYYYVGSAQKGFSKRVLRHLRKDKKLHWHIDYITTIKSGCIERISIIENAAKSVEAELAYVLTSIFKLDDSILGFGNSDTKKTKTHLFYSKSQIDYNHLLSLYQSIVCFIPSSNDTF